MDYIDFIDAPAVRDHLRTLPQLPPAQRCILIAQSGIRSLPDKLAALREIRAATPPEDFARGCWSFQCDDPFPVILDRYLRTREERLAAFRTAEPGVVYVVETGGRYSRGVDESDMELYGVSWHRRTGSFGHEHVFFTRFGTQRVAPADLPKEEKMLDDLLAKLRKP